jgi:hypothetical protein
LIRLSAFVEKRISAHICTIVRVEVKEGEGRNNDWASSGGNESKTTTQSHKLHTR